MYPQFARTFFSVKYEHLLVTTLRFTLALIFVWFGALKVLGFNPVFDLITNSAMPFLAEGYGLVILGVVEVLIGLLLVLNRALLFTHTIVVLHLLGTFSTFIFGWNLMFDPYVPVLSFEGEFVIKNMTLAIAGLVVLVHEARRRK